MNFTNFSQLNQSMFLQEKKLLTAGLKQFDSVQLKSVTEQIKDNSNFDVKSINKRIQSGDFTALEDLEKAGISYTQESKTYTGDNGKKYTKTIIKYNYDSIFYTINNIKAADTTENATGTSNKETTDFNDYKTLRNFIFSNEARELIKQNNITDFSHGFVYENIADTVALNHKEDFASVTKEQLIKEFKTEYESRSKETKNTSTSTGTETKTTETTASNTTTTTQTNSKEKLKTAYANILQSLRKVQYGGLSSGSDNLLNSLEDVIYEQIAKDGNEDSLAAIGGKSTLRNLLQAVNNKLAPTKIGFSDLPKLIQIFTNLSYDPDNVKYYTDTAHADTSLLNNLSNLNSSLNVSKFMRFDDGAYHLDDDTSDKLYQETMNQLLEKIYDKYSDIDKNYLKKLFYGAQNTALVTLKMHETIDMNSLIQTTLLQLDRLLMNNCISMPKRNTETNKTESTQDIVSISDDKKSNIKSASENIADAVLDVHDSIIANCKEAIGKSGNVSIHTEFGMDTNGNIVFQDKNTTTVYNTIQTKIKNKLNRNAYKEALANIGGEEVINKLIQSAWIMTYNTYNSSQSNNLNDFVNKMMSNLENMLTKLQTNPELITAYTQRTSYADPSLTNGLKHYNTKTTYGNDERINTSGNVTTYADGSVHISNTTDDNDYQTTMNVLLERLIKKYPSINKQTIIEVFRDAQKAALYAEQQNIYDCPYGTGNNSGRVEDGNNKNWGGKDNRKGDKGNIDMDQLVQYTLYYFDKLLLQKL